MVLTIPIALNHCVGIRLTGITFAKFFWSIAWSVTTVRLLPGDALPGDALPGDALQVAGLLSSEPGNYPVVTR